MLRNDNMHKASDFTNEDFLNRMNSYFNPYEYNLESNYKNNLNSDKEKSKSKSHIDRKIKK